MRCSYRITKKDKKLEEMKRPQWSSQLAFIVASIGSAVGLGNIWRFPYIMGEYGGAVFLFIYLGLIFTICILPLISELFLGKFFQRNIVSIFETINKKCSVFGWLCIVTAILIPCFYFVVGGWILNYIYMSVANIQIADYTKYFSDFVASPAVQPFCTLLFLILTVMITYRGVNKGIEKANNIMMPAFALILIILAICSLNLPNAERGIEFMFRPDFSKVNIRMILIALGQALFTLSIGMGALTTYGSYLKKDAKIVRLSYILAFFDTLLAVLAGIMIFPAVFSFGLEPGAGPNLVFITMPHIFNQLPFGNIVSLLFFTLIFFAAITSGISLLETSVLTFIEKFNMSREKAVLVLTGIITLITVPTSLSYGILKGMTFNGLNLFEFLDFTTSNILLPFNTLIICLIVGWVIKPSNMLITKRKWCFKILNFALKYVIPVVLVSLMYFGLEG